MDNRKPVFLTIAIAKIGIATRASNKSMPIIGIRAPTGSSFVHVDHITAIRKPQKSKLETVTDPIASRASGYDDDVGDKLKVDSQANAKTENVRVALNSTVVLTISLHFFNQKHKDQEDRKCTGTLLKLLYFCPRGVVIHRAFDRMIASQSTFLRLR